MPTANVLLHINMYLTLVTCQVFLLVHTFNHITGQLHPKQQGTVTQVVRSTFPFGTRMYVISVQGQTSKATGDTGSGTGSKACRRVT